MKPSDGGRITEWLETNKPNNATIETFLEGGEDIPK